MTLVPEYRICPKCHKRYSWNPDVGKMFCPRCGRGKIRFGNLALDVILGRKSKKEN